MQNTNRHFWTRLTATAFVVNVPLAIAVVAGVMSLMFGLLFSGVLGVGILVIWDGTRVPVAAADDATMAMAPAPTTGAEVRQAGRSRSPQNH